MNRNTSSSRIRRRRRRRRSRGSSIQSMRFRSFYTTHLKRHCHFRRESFHIAIQFATSQSMSTKSAGNSIESSPNTMLR